MAFKPTWTQRPGRMRNWTTWVVAGWLAVLAGWTTYVVATDRPVDYYVYLFAADAFSQGKNIYRDSSLYAIEAARFGVTNYAPPYRYPLLTALALVPLLESPIRLGAAIAIFGSGLAAVSSALILAARTDPVRRLLVLGAGALFVPFYTTMHAGQINAFPLLFLTLSIALLARRGTLAGVLLAVSLWIKPFAFAIVPWLVWRRQWSALAGLASGSALIFLAGLLAFGIEPSLDQLRIGGSVASWGTFVTLPTNQNLNGLVGHWLTAHSYGASLGDVPGIAWSIYLGLAGLAAAAAAYVLLRSGRTDRTLWLQAALVILTTELVFPLTSYHHLAIEFLAVAALLVDPGVPVRLTAGRIALVAALVMMTVTGLAWKLLVGTTALLDLTTFAQIILWSLVARRLIAGPLGSVGPESLRTHASGTPDIAGQG